MLPFMHYSFLAFKLLISTSPCVLSDYTNHTLLTTQLPNNDIRSEELNMAILIA